MIISCHITAESFVSDAAQCDIVLLADPEEAATKSASGQEGFSVNLHTLCNSIDVHEPNVVWISIDMPEMCCRQARQELKALKEQEALFADEGSQDLNGSAEGLL